MAEAQALPVEVFPDIDAPPTALQNAEWLWSQFARLSFLPGPFSDWGWQVVIRAHSDGRATASLAADPPPGGKAILGQCEMAADAESMDRVEAGVFIAGVIEECVEWRLCETLLTDGKPQTQRQDFFHHKEGVPQGVGSAPG